jgi:O-antigen/teichoic acid export membrane protein
MWKKKDTITILLIIAVLPFLLIWGTLIFTNIGRGQGPIQASNVLYLVGDPSYTTGYSDQPIRALQLDAENINLNVTNLSGDFDYALSSDTVDTIILNDYNLTLTQIGLLNTWLQTDGNGLIIIMGPQLTEGNSILSILGINPGVVAFQPNDLEFKPFETKISSVKAICNINSSATHPIFNSISWNSASELLNYTKIPNIDTISGNHEYIYMGLETGTVTPNSLVFGRSLLVGEEYDNVIVFASWLTDSVNVEFQLWAYFNYAIFLSTQDVAGKPILTYAQWMYSPVPHMVDQTLLGMLVAIGGIIAILLYKRARKRGEPNRLKWEVIERIQIEISGKNSSVKEYLQNKSQTKSQLSDTEQFVLTDLSKEERSLVAVREISNEEVKAVKWEKIGFHRQQAGFLQTIFSLIFLIIPQLIVTSFIFPMFIQPHPAATGMYSFTLRFFEAIWLIFDMGTRYSFVKFFAANRIEHPEKAFHYAQIFVWWQLLSGVVQVTMFSFFGSIIFPVTSLSYLSWMFIAHSLTQYPGIFLVFQYFFQGMQHADKAMITNVLQQFLLRMIAQIITVPLFRLLYAGSMAYGDAFGAALGLVVGQYVGDIMMFLITIKWYNQLKIGLGPIFGAEFTKAEFKESLKFGSKLAIGEVWVPAVWLLQVLLVSIYIPNYAAQQGYFELAWTISQIPQAAALLFEGCLAGYTEAVEFKKPTLRNYYSGASMRFGMFWTIFLCSALWAIGPSFIIGTAGQGWARAADFLPLLVLFNLLGPFSWQGDKEFMAADKANLAGIAWILEQAIRAVVMLIFLPFFNIMETVIISYIISLAIKDVFVWILIETKIHKHTWYAYTTFLAPAFSGIFVYIILSVAVILLGSGIVSVLILFVSTFFVVLFIYSFLTGFFGMYDNNTLAELKRSAEMVTGVGFLARGLYKSAELGTKVSPLHGKFPITIFEQAYKEADELTAIKRAIVSK